MLKKNALNLLLLVLLCSFHSSCGDDPESATDTDGAGDIDSDADTDTDTDADSDSDTDTDTDTDADTDSDTDSDTDVDTDSDTNNDYTCTFECRGPNWCDNNSGISHAELTCPEEDQLCCEAGGDTDVDTDADTDVDTDADTDSDVYTCTFECRGLNWCDNNSGISHAELTCPEEDQLCCEAEGEPYDGDDTDEVVPIGVITIQGYPTPN